MSDLMPAREKPPILVIDDDRGHLLILADILENEGLQPICCQTGQEALSMCTAYNAYVAILDLHLSDTDGLQLLGRLLQENPCLKVIIHTGYASLDSALAAVNCGAFAYVQKRGDVEELLAHIHRAFHLHWASHSEALKHEVQQRTQALARANDDLRKEIAKHQQTEEALRHSEQLLQATLDALSANLAILDETSTILAVNASWRQFAEDNGFGGPSRGIGVNYLQLCDEATDADSEETPEVARGIRAVMARQRERFTLEYPCHSPDTQRWFVMRLTRFDDGGKPRLVVVHEEITERVQAEAQRQRLEAQLREAHKMEAVGTLAGGIAHDFNNILASIFLHTEVAQSYVRPGSELQDNLQNVMTAAKRAKNLVQQILMFSRQTETVRQPVRLSLLIQDALTFLRASLPATIDIRHNLLDTGDTILADPVQLRQIVLNICVNAEYAMRQTGGILEINTDRIEIDETLAQAHPALKPGPHLCLIIRDSGYGIAPQVIERIFEPFFTTKDVGQGTGMGLAMVHGMVTNHGGAITVESLPGQGTTFTIYLPCLSDVESERDSAQELIGDGDGRILFVDDEPALARPVQVLLERFGYQVVSSASSHEAFDIFCRDPYGFDLLLTDQTMPHMTGEQLAREVRRVRPDMPVILCTGFSHVMNAEKARELGFNDFCTKPLLAQELALKIQQVLKQRSQSSSPARQRILLIDDDDQFRRGLCQMLELEGYEMVEARNGREGVKRYREEPTDLIITDLLMPDQDGVETISELKRDFPDAKIIAISGGGQTGKRNYLYIAQRLGAHRTLNKPFSRDELLMAIQELI